MLLDMVTFARNTRSRQDRSHPDSRQGAGPNGETLNRRCRRTMGYSAFNGRPAGRRDSYVPLVERLPYEGASTVSRH